MDRKEEIKIEEEEQRRMKSLLRFDGFCHAYVGRRVKHKTEKEHNR